jgi:hypothetical protein
LKEKDYFDIQTKIARFAKKMKKLLKNIMQKKIQACSVNKKT